MHYNKKIIYMIMAFLALNSAVYSQAISFSMNSVTVKQAISELKKQTGYSFVYSVDDLNTQKTVSVSIQNGKIEDAVKQILAGQDVSYQIQGNNIVVKKNSSSNSVQGSQGKKLKRVTGVIIDEKDIPVPGASVVVKGESNGVVSDFDGAFSIDAPENGVLEISYVGYVTQAVPLNGKYTVKVKLIQAIKSLDEVVVTGYATQKKKNITGSVETVKASEEMHLASTTAAGNLLQSKVSGVFVSTPSGVPGSQPSISIRQNSSWNAQNVLYVIDGVLKGSGDFNNLSPNEIETFTVLKDASAAAVYGARAAGGVIVVTTRKGEVGKMKLDYSYSYGIDKRTKNGDLASAVQMGQLNNKFYGPNDWRYHSAEDLAFLQTINGGWGYDQLGEVWTDPSIATHNLSVSGGSDKIKYFAGLSNVNQKSFIKTYGYEKTNFRFNTTANITDNLQFFAGMAFSATENFSPYFTDYVASDPNGIYRKLLLWQPYQPVYTDKGQYAHYGWVANIGAETNGEAGYNNTYTYKPDINVNLVYKIPAVPGLSLKAAYAASWTNAHNDQFKKFYQMALLPANSTGHIIDTNDDHILGYRNNSISYPSLYKKATWSHDYQLNLQANYAHTFGKHDVSGVIGYESSEADGAGVYGGREKVPVYLTDQFWAFSSARADDWGGGDTSYLNGRKSVIGQANYAFANKYLVSGSFRYDGSMNFAQDYRWGFFPAGSVGWVISEEDFFGSAKDVVNRLKISASAGLTGNDAVGGWQWQESYETANKAYFGEGGTNISQGIRYGNIVNPNITWEKTLSYNFRADVDFLKHWNASLEYWIADTYDILGSRIASVPTSFSGTLPAENYGEVKAQGIDFSIGYKNRVGEFSYFVNANASYGWNEVVTADYATNSQPIDIPVGKSRNRIVGYQSEPMIRTQAELDAFNSAHPGYLLNGYAPYLGMLPIKDISGPNGQVDGVINSWDRVEISSDNTPVNFGFTLGGDYKGFNLEAVFGGQAGYKKSFQEITGNVEWNRMDPRWLTDSWSSETPNAFLPKALPYYDSASTTYRDANSDYWYKDASYLRLQFLNFGYDFKELSKIPAINHLKLYVTGSNLFVISKFNKDFWDPQGGAYSYPIVKSFSVGLNVGF